MKHLLMIVLVAMLTPSLAQAQASPQLTQAERREVTRAVKDLLRDPNSAQIAVQSIMRSTQAPEVWVCGEVNSRNGFGGMGGPTMFTAVLRSGRALTARLGPQGMPSTC